MIVCAVTGMKKWFRSDNCTAYSAGLQCSKPHFDRNEFKYVAASYQSMSKSVRFSKEFLPDNEPKVASAAILNQRMEDSPLSFNR